MVTGIGIDITEVRRLRQAIQRWGDIFLERVFTREELVNAKTRNSFYQHLAGRFAAKEAVFKALGEPRLSWKDVQIINDKQGKPHCRILNGIAKDINIYVSISHVKTYATAFAIITQES